MPKSWGEFPVCGFDIETSGNPPEYALQPWRFEQGAAWITCCAMAVHNYPSYDKTKLFPNPAFFRRTLEEVIKNEVTLCCWNAAFEISWMVAYGCSDLVHKIKWLDGMLLWRHLEITPEWGKGKNARRVFGLKEAVKTYMKQYAGYENGVNFHSTAPRNLEQLRQYNLIDAKCTQHIVGLFYRRLQKNPKQLQAALIESDSLSEVGSANYHGIPLDGLYCEYLKSILHKKRIEAQQNLPEEVTKKVMASPTQLRKLLFEDWGLPSQRETKTGNKSTDKETLLDLSVLDNRVSRIADYRESTNNLTKFAETPLKALAYNQDGRAHPIAQVFSTYTGRMTYSSFQGRATAKNKLQIGWALHQEKRDPVFRGIVVAPPGYTLCEFDASGQEFRWMAIASGDETMLALCLPGQDPHAYMAANIMGMDYRRLQLAAKHGQKDAKQFRMLGKVANLSLQYRTSHNKLRSVAKVQYGVEMKAALSQHIQTVYIRTYRRVPQYWTRQITFYRQMGYAETLAGRRVNIKINNFSNTWPADSTAINFRIQGTGADQKYLAISVLKNYIHLHGIKFAFELHDGLYLWVPDKIVSNVVPKIQHLLNNLPYKKAWDFEPPIPLPWDAKIGKSWDTLEEWNG